MIPSPPQEAAQIRGKTLTPVSPKPVHFPSPSNIPILEKQMDPAFNESASVAQAAAAPYQPSSYQQYYSANPSVNDQMFGGQDAMSAGSSAAPGAGSDAFANSAKAYGYDGSSAQDTASIQQQFPAAAASSDPAQDRSMPPSYDPTAQLTSAAFAQAARPQGSSHTAAGGPEPTMSDSSGGVDFQTLLDQLSASSSAVAAVAAVRDGVAGASQQGATSPTSTLPGHPNLPPRPPPQEKPATHPNYAPDDDIRSYHPHSQKNPSASYRSQPGLTPLVTTGTAAAGAAHPTPMSASQTSNTPATPGFRGAQTGESRSEKSAGGGGDDDAPWPADTERLFDQFLQDERANVTEGQWDKFPPGSRLFIGNLPTEKVTKRDLFQIFHKYGRLAQISLKQAYGFVQFLDSDACARALRAEQGSTVRGRKMHLEISKPQRSNRDGNKEGGRAARRRSRSPDYTRGGTGAVPRNVDRYTSGSGSGGSGRDRDYRRSRDDYRPVRSPSPRGRRDRERYSRDRSRSPYNDRYRDRSPRRETEDDLPLPRRAPQSVPDVQFIILDAVDSQFVQYVENIFQQRGLRTNALHMSPRLSEAAVIRRQIVEGVQAVVKLTYNAQNTVKIPLQVFDRSAGADNVRFDEYQDLGPDIAAELVIRAKQTHRAPGAPAYAPAPTYSMPAAPQAPAYGVNAPQLAAAAANPALASMIGNLDGASLQHLLASLQPNAQSQQQAPASTALTPDLSRLLSSLGQQAGYPQATPTPNGAQGNAYGAGSYPASLNSLFSSATAQAAQQQPGGGQTAAQAQAQGQPDMQDILAQLAAYKRT